MNFLKRILERKYRTSYNVDDVLLMYEIKRGNRIMLNTVPQWLSGDVIEKSYFDYGVPPSIRSLLDLDIGSEVTYTDLVCYYSRLLKNINYLEIGVSVGKNFLQLVNYLENAQLTGFDIENINPVLSNHLKFISCHDWKTQTNSLRKENSYLKEYQYRTNMVSYLAGDIWDEASWKKLSDQKFNIIFSDALHDPKALLWEYEMIKRYSLLADDFIFIWDDLNHGLEASFKKITSDLRKQRNIGHEKVYLFKINGWLGKNFPEKHDIGIISNLNLS